MKAEIPAKRKAGRPAGSAGQKGPRRPVLTARAPQAAYEKIVAAAKASGRTQGEELVWRALQSFELEAKVDELLEQIDHHLDELYHWQHRYRDLQTMEANAKRALAEITDEHWQGQLRLHGYHFVRGARPDDPNYGAWFGPNVDHVSWVYETAPGRRLIEGMVREAAHLGAKTALEGLLGRATDLAGRQP
jgi:hypothetical protein